MSESLQVWSNAAGRQAVVAELCLARVCCEGSHDDNGARCNGGGGGVAQYPAPSRSAGQPTGHWRLGAALLRACGARNAKTNPGPASTTAAGIPQGAETRGNDVVVSLMPPSPPVLFLTLHDGGCRLQAAAGCMQAPTDPRPDLHQPSPCQIVHRVIVAAPENLITTHTRGGDTVSAATLPHLVASRRPTFRRECLASGYRFQQRYLGLRPR